MLACEELDELWGDSGGCCCCRFGFWSEMGSVRGSFGDFFASGMVRGGCVPKDSGVLGEGRAGLGGGAEEG